MTNNTSFPRPSASVSGCSLPEAPFTADGPGSFYDNKSDRVVFRLQNLHATLYRKNPNGLQEHRIFMGLCIMQSPAKQRKRRNFHFQN